ncbi:DUF1576 domain-containing protein [Aerococcus agrisoli]|uniref:DUF1576 domain-containing protein n=1 Tax=Aerococcus agrisoli TaxID=2487350 RepID=A0A3N4G853_9LACT|nr:DUF1576 domain-containing protein [Aerococcus agrisoli]RPA58923.1 DUF1576 domain-containing protein [Aerococcus agrisoli]
MARTLDQGLQKLLAYYFEQTAIKPLFFFTLAILFILFGLSIQPLPSIIDGYWTILISPSNLITDYFAVGGIGATFVNVGSLLLVNTYLIQKRVSKISGPLLAAMMTVMGFSFFGKNLYNTIPFFIGTYFYSKYSGNSLSRLMIAALFSSGLSPVVSIITFGQDLPIYVSMPIGIAVGIIIGFIIHPVAASFLRFHQGYNLYNIGFTAGVIGMIVTSIMLIFQLPVTYTIETKEITSPYVTLLFVCISIIFFLSGFALNGYSMKNYMKISKTSGRLITDFVTELGTPITLMNMGIQGLLSLSYVFLVGGHLDGAVIGGVLTVIGFSAFGKHPFNVTPVVIGVFLMQSAMSIGSPSSTNSLLAALFGTTLAPIAGSYGFFAGMIAGALHAAVVQNTSDSHAGLNLYNNGFSGGFVAAFLVPILDVIKERKQNNERTR